MIFYQNRTFCREETCARFGDQEGDCNRSLTKKIKQEAALWWSDATGNEECPISVYSSRPDCYIKLVDEVEK